MAKGKESDGWCDSKKYNHASSVINSAFRNDSTLRGEYRGNFFARIPDSEILLDAIEVFIQFLPSTI